MSRLVNTDDLYELIDKHFDGVRVYDVFPSDAVYDFHRIVDSTPTVDAELVRHGHWEKLYDRNYKCSVCGAWYEEDEEEEILRFDYCPHCGAKMDGE